MSRFRYSFSQPWSWHRRPQLPHQQRGTAPVRSCCQGRRQRRALRGAGVQPSTRAICLRVTSFEATSNVAVVEMFIDAPAGRMAVGMAFDRRHDLLFVAGGFTGQAYVYDTRSGETVKSYDFVTDGTSLINDVTLTGSGAWFTDSTKAMLYFVEVSKRASLSFSDGQSHRTGCRAQRAVQPQWHRSR